MSRPPWPPRKTSKLQGSDVLGRPHRIGSQCTLGDLLHRLHNPTDLSTSACYSGARTQRSATQRCLPLHKCRFRTPRGGLQCRLQEYGKCIRCEPQLAKSRVQGRYRKGRHSLEHFQGEDQCRTSWRRCVGPRI